MKWINKHFFRKFQSGFSLMELMVVIAIIGILGSISIPRLMNPEHKASKAARELMGDMQRTRMSAIKNNQDWAIVFDPAGNKYYICSNLGDPPDWSTLNDKTIEKTVSFTNYAAGLQYGGGIATGNAIDGGAFPAGFVDYDLNNALTFSNVLTFSSAGTCSGDEEYVYFFYGNASYAIGTLSTGIVRIQRWSGGAWQ